MDPQVTHPLKPHLETRTDRDASSDRGWNRTQGACRKGLSVKEVMGVIRDMIPSKKLGVGL